MEEDLRWKTALLEAQVDSTLDGILIVDGRGKKILQNQRMNDLWKIPPHIAEDKDDAAQVILSPLGQRIPSSLPIKSPTCIRILTRSAGMKFS